MSRAFNLENLSDEQREEIFKIVGEGKPAKEKAKKTRVRTKRMAKLSGYTILMYQTPEKALRVNCLDAMPEEYIVLPKGKDWKDAKKAGRVLVDFIKAKKAYEELKAVLK